MESKSVEMTLENLKKKIENQSKTLKELTNENEELYHQYNHLIIRNGKLLKRIDDFQKIIEDLHIRIEELQLINGNMMQLNDKLRNRNDITERMKEEAEVKIKSEQESAAEKIAAGFDLEDLFSRWKTFPGQLAQNEPNLRKQVLMLIHLYSIPSLRAADLFNRAGVGGVTGARYVSMLKKFELIQFSGARKKGQYVITGKGINFIENSRLQNAKGTDEPPQSSNSSVVAF